MRTIYAKKIPDYISQGDYRIKLESNDPQHPAASATCHSYQGDFAGLSFNYCPVKSLIPDHSNTNGSQILHGSHNHFHFCNLFALIIDSNEFNYLSIVPQNPQGFVIRTWPSRYPTYGVASLTYQLLSNPMSNIFEAMLSVPAYVLDSDETYMVQGTTSIHVHSGFVANGNMMTVHVYARPGNSAENDYQLAKEERFP
uniref:Uncharacterized protein n=1 Tax=Daphnia galeata TaxID=27404 RepID=A0A8J2RHD3_9CRUS|nr:unnamed protein product [Daphnia galeata]